MIITGIDLIEVERIRSAVEQHGERFLQRVYTPDEIEQFRDNYTSLAARWAAKEAVAKALGTGIGDVEWVEIEVLRGEHREPVLRLLGNAKRIAQEKKITEWSISLSHTHEHAIAMVVAKTE